MRRKTVLLPVSELDKCIAAGGAECNARFPTPVINRTGVRRNEARKRIVRRFNDGKVSIPYGQFLGYRKGADRLPKIVP